MGNLLLRLRISDHNVGAENLETDTSEILWVDFLENKFDVFVHTTERSTDLDGTNFDEEVKPMEFWLDGNLR